MMLKVEAAYFNIFHLRVLMLYIWTERYQELDGGRCLWRANNNKKQKQKRKIK